MPDKGILGYRCTEDEQLLYWLNPAHLLCGSVSLFLEHMCYSALPGTQMTTAKSSTPHDFSSMISAELRPDWKRLPTGSLYQHTATNADHLAKRCQLGTQLTAGKLTNRLPKCFCHLKKESLVWNKYYPETVCKVSKCLTKTFILVLVG